MSTLLLRIAGPMQSWGTQSRFTQRDTGREPSKSGVVGLIAAALGRPRTASLADLASLRMGVRVNSEGQMLRDYHTVGGSTRGSTDEYGVAIFSGKGTSVVLSNRFYLADADFLVGLEAANPAQETLLRTIDAALAQPVWPLFLGRRAFVPGRPIRQPDHPPLGPGLRDLTLDAALLQYPWPRHAQQLRCVLEDASGQGGAIRMDQPIAFTSENREYQPRFVAITQLRRPSDAVTLEEVDL